MKVYQIVLLVIVLVGGAYFIGGKINKEVIYRQVEKEVILDNLKGKVNQLKGELIKSIWDNERGGHVEADGLITFDPNPKNKNVQIASIGTCQFKQSTVQYYYKTLYGKELNGKQANDIAFSDEKCKELMTDIVFKVKDGHEEWYNTCKKVDCDGQLKVINTLLN